MEKAARTFAQDSGISLVTVCPAFTVGEAPATIVHTSVPVILSLLTGDDEKIRSLELVDRASGSIPMVHVHDLCRAKIFLAEEEAASGRYICSSLDTTLAELATFLAAKYPQYNVNTDRFGGRLEKLRVCISSAKLIGEGFEFRYKALDEIYDDVVNYGRSLGILPY
ncbi:anthocyanidin reductase ((2S)-flavan-3-ol-forming)-like [Triticum dicoccoides]|uniref:anthocyanidin reductase ((2S)-flavan-3-ol-forming)-like n=1 Tax=Triticum dicoccoides TaxID=85692 RepID=UPI0018906933|nr:anthocyanidin reductase ((2S)-flavan-3-ol-forming)-like [Triticum dicoccoides]